MCGRYSLLEDLPALSSMFSVEGKAAIPPRYNIAPTQPVLIVRIGEEGSVSEGKRELAAVEWAFTPEWAKERGTKPLLNARIETVEVKPSFRSSIKRRRCLVPFSGWYEWKSEDGRKQPYYITPTEGGVHAFAGIWSTWHGPSGEHWLETMAILTAPAEGPLRKVHHRRPLVVQPHEFDHWLTPHDPLPRGFLDNMNWLGENAFHWRRVSTRVSSARFDDPSCLDSPVEDSQTSLF